MSISDDDLDFQADISWLTIETINIDAVVEALQLKGIRQGRWRDAYEKINEKRQMTANTFLYVSQNTWVVVLYEWKFIGCDCVDNTSSIQELCLQARENLIIKLSQQFSEAQLFEFDTEYFCGPTCWMFAHNGQLIRSFIYDLSSNFLRNFGKPTTAEDFMDWFRVEGLESWTKEDWEIWEEEEDGQSNLFLGCRGDCPKAVETIKVARQWSVDPLYTDHPEERIGILGRGGFLI